MRRSQLSRPCSRSWQGSVGLISWYEIRVHFYHWYNHFRLDQQFRHHQHVCVHGQYLMCDLAGRRDDHVYFYLWFGWRDEMALIFHWRVCCGEFPGLVPWNEHVIEVECGLVPVKVDLRHFHAIMIHISVGWRTSRVLYFVQLTIVDRWWRLWINMWPVARPRFESLAVISKVSCIRSWSCIVRMVVMGDLHGMDGMVLWDVWPHHLIQVLPFIDFWRSVS